MRRRPDPRTLAGDALTRAPGSGLSTQSVVRVSADSIGCELAGEAVLFHMGCGVYYGLDPVGTRIWQLVQEPRRVGDIRNALVAEYEVDAARCEADLLALVAALAAAGLVDVSD